MGKIRTRFDWDAPVEICVDDTWVRLPDDHPTAVALRRLKTDTRIRAADAAEGLPSPIGGGWRRWVLDRVPPVGRARSWAENARFAVWYGTYLVLIAGTYVAAFKLLVWLLFR